jgi:DNA-binding HxlR family transcriptional regulator
MKTIDIFVPIIMAVLSGLSIRIMLSLVKQKWASTYHHTMSYMLLPVVTLVITTVISGNIALSLGMIGALSIVRFRNPVKNPFELVVFFALITIGISMAVNTSYGAVLTIVIDALILISYLVEKIAKRYDLHIFSISFHEGNQHNILEINSTIALKELEKNKLLTQFVYSKTSNEYHYRLASSSREFLELIKDSVSSEEGVESIEIRYA